MPNKSLQRKADCRRWLCDGRRFALILGSIPSFIGMLLTALVPVIIRAKAEDKLFEEKFGEDYIKYKQSTFVFIPFIY